MYKNALKDCLHNLSYVENGNSYLMCLYGDYPTRDMRKDEVKLAYYAGLLNGMLSALSLRMNYKTACEKVKDSLPIDCIDLDLIDSNLIKDIKGD